MRFFLLPFLLIFTQLLYSSIALADTQLSYEARIHPQSPTSCGIDIIEIGKWDENHSEFIPELAFLQDRYDDTYPQASPKVRTLYSYLADPQTEAAIVNKADLSPEDQALANRDDEQNSQFVTRYYSHPLEVTNIDSTKASVLFYVTFEMGVIGASLFGIGPGTLGILADMFIQHYKKTREFYRTQAIYAIELLLGTHNPSLYAIADPDALYELSAVAREYSFRGLFLPAKLRRMVAEYQRDQRNLNRTTSYANLLSIINREGLIAYPLLSDFVIVYYDPKKDYGRPIDFGYTDLGSHLPSSEGLVPLGVYAISEAKDRILTADLNYGGKAKERSWIQSLVRYGNETGTTFIPFPFSFLLTVTKSGIHWVLEKGGNNVLTSTLQSQAELLTILQSGMVDIDPALSQRIKKDMTTFWNDHSDTKDQFRSNAALMTQYLQKRGAALCEHIQSQREAEFQDTYLGFFERLARKWKLFWREIVGQPLDTPNSRSAQERKQLINERHEQVSARILLDYYDETRLSNQPEAVLQALTQMSLTHEGDDAERIEKVIIQTVNTDLLMGAVSAAALNQHYLLQSPLLKLLKDLTLNGFYEPELVDNIIEALSQIDIENSPFTFSQYTDVLWELNSLLEQTAIPSHTRELAERVRSKLSERFTLWKTLHTENAS